MPKRRTLTITEGEREALVKHRDHDTRPYVRERCGALLKIADGMSAHRVAQEGLLKRRDPDTVYKWLNDYEADGLLGVVGHQQGGNQRRSV